MRDRPPAGPSLDSAFPLSLPPMPARTPRLHAPPRLGALRPLLVLAVAALLASTLLASGCDFLETTPQGQLTTENFYETEEDARRAVAAAYSGLQDPTDYLLPYVVAFGSVASDDAAKGGESGNDQPDLQAVQTFTLNPTNGYVSLAWNELYGGVRLANLVIANVPEIEMDAGLRDRLVAEAKFLRAYYYHYLLLHFGLEGQGVPLITEPVQNDEADVARSSESEVWAFIEQDLTEAAAVLPATYGAADVGRATRGAAQALLLKAYMFQEAWGPAEALAAEIIDSGTYSLSPSYASIFTLEGEYGPGSIFEIGYANINAQAEGTDGVVYQTSRSTWGYGFNCPTQDFVDAFEDGDPRLDATVIVDGEEMPDGTTVSTAASPTGYHNQKIWIPQNVWPQNAGGDVLDGPVNRRFLRLAQVLLWHAEAANENGNASAALESLNRVRRRARDDDDDPSNDPAGVLPDIETTDQAALREAIYREQRVELGMEYHRFFELVRQGRAAEALAGTAFNPATHVRLPIPQLQIDLSDGVLTQNPGY